MHSPEFGHGEGQWCICPDYATSNSVVYSFEVGHDTSFDLIIIERFGAEVHASDPTPLSLNWIRRQPTPCEFNFHPYGLANYNGIVKFYLPLKHGISFTTMSNIESKVLAEGQVYRFRTLLDKLGHARIGIVKLDIEGAEYDLLPDILEEFACSRGSGQ